MIPYQQLYDHNPTAGVYGDCYRTALGCLLHIPPEEVPHFCDFSVYSDEEWAGHRDRWLAERGLGRVIINYVGSEVEEILHYFEEINPGCYYLLAGNTADAVPHVVICQGGQVIHNPNRYDVPIVAPLEEGNYEITLLVPLQPQQVAAAGLEANS